MEGGSVQKRKGCLNYTIALQAVEYGDIVRRMNGVKIFRSLRDFSLIGLAIFVSLFIWPFLFAKHIVHKVFSPETPESDIRLYAQGLLFFIGIVVLFVIIQFVLPRFGISWFQFDIEGY